MARRKTHAPLNVLINGRLVGQLRKEASGAVSFQYDQSWLDWSPAFAISLSLPMREAAYSGAPVVAVFDNLLPVMRLCVGASPNAWARKELTITVCSKPLGATASARCSS
jgi:HipA-like protein